MEVTATAFHDARGRVEILAVLRDDDIHDSSIRTVLRAIRSLEDRGTPVDVHTLGAELHSVLPTLGTSDAQGVNFLADIMRRGAAAPKHAVAWAKHLRSLAQRRRIIEACAMVTGEGFTLEQDAAETFPARALETMATACISESATGGPQALGELTKPMLVELGEQWAGKRDPWGMRFPYPTLQRMTRGARPGEVVFIGGDTGSGKTVIALQTALDLAGRTYRGETIAVGYLSLEMPRGDIWKRAVASLIEDPFTKRRGVLKTSEINEGPKAEDGKELDLGRCAWIEHAAHTLEAMPIFIEDCEHDTAQIRASVRRMQAMARRRNARLRAVFLDHFHLLDFESAERQDIAIGKACKYLKRVAIDESLVMYPLGQFNREASKRAPDQLPTVTDMKDGSAIEQISDTIINMHRPYLLHRNKGTPEAREIKSLAKAVVAKNRGNDGWLGAVNLRFAGTNVFEEVDTDTE